MPLAVDFGIIEQHGAYYTLPGGERLLGLERVIERVRGDEELQALLRKKIAEIPEV